eukprot:3182637-Amphidinium_carterae.1
MLGLYFTRLSCSPNSRAQQEAQQLEKRRTACHPVRCPVGAITPCPAVTRIAAASACQLPKSTSGIPPSAALTHMSGVDVWGDSMAARLEEASSHVAQSADSSKPPTTSGLKRPACSEVCCKLQTAEDHNLTMLPAQLARVLCVGNTTGKNHLVAVLVPACFPKRTCLG